MRIFLSWSQLLCVCFSSLTFCSHLLPAQEKETGKDRYEQESTAKEIVLWLGQTVGIPVSFCEEDYSVKDSILLGEKLADLKHKKSLSVIEELQIRAFSESVAEDESRSESIVGYQVQNFAVNRNLVNMDNIVHAVQQLRLSYDVKRESDGLLVLPNSTDLSRLITFKATGAAKDVLIRFNDEVLKNIGLGLIFTDRNLMSRMETETVSLDLQQVDLFKSLSLISQSLGPDVTWTILGPREHRFLQFGIFDRDKLPLDTLNELAERLRRR